MKPLNDTFKQQTGNAEICNRRMFLEIVLKPGRALQALSSVKSR